MPLRLLILLSLFTLGLSACVSLAIQNRTAYAVNGDLSNGATGADTINENTCQLTVDQTLDTLEARPSPLPDPCHSGAVIQAHPAAVFQSAADYGTETVELDQACRDLGNDCSYALQQTIKRRKMFLTNLQAPNDPVLH